MTRNLLDDLRFDGLAQWDTADGRQVTRATVSVLHEGRTVAELHPRKDYYYAAQQPMSIAGLYPSLSGKVYDIGQFWRAAAQADFYVLLVGWQPIGTDGATFKIYYNPLVNWLWSGAFIFIFGTLIAAWPDLAEARRVAVVQRPVPAVSGAD